MRREKMYINQHRTELDKNLYFFIYTYVSKIRITFVKTISLYKYGLNIIVRCTQPMVELMQMWLCVCDFCAYHQYNLK